MKRAKAEDLAAIVRLDAEGLSHSQIAARFKTSSQTIKSRLTQASNIVRDARVIMDGSGIRPPDGLLSQAVAVTPRWVRSRNRVPNADLVAARITDSDPAFEARARWGFVNVRCVGAPRAVALTGQILWFVENEDRDDVLGRSVRRLVRASREYS